MNASVILTLVVGPINKVLLVSHLFLFDLLQVVRMIICLGYSSTKAESVINKLYGV